jgi:biopolymer transport protein ExbB/TolQ
MINTEAMSLSLSVGSGMYDLGQLFLIPVQLLILLLFVYAFFSLGRFVRQGWGRRRGREAAFELVRLQHRGPAVSLETLEAEAVKRLELVRIVTRVTPMLGLAATMIPMGPALKALGDGQLGDVSQSLTVAFSAVILSLITSSITYAIAHVRRRWYAADLLALNQEQGEFA